MKKRVIIFVVGIVLLIGFNYFINKNNLLENITKDVSYKITRLFNGGKEINLSKDMLISKNEALEKEIAELSNLLKLNETTSKYSIINATIINRNMEEFYDTVIINKGYNDGVDIGYDVIPHDV